MEDPIEIRLLQEKDIAQVNALHNRLYGHSRTEKQFRWEFLEGPAGEAVYVIALDKNKKTVVGMQCAIPLLLKTGNETILTAKSEDTLVDPDYRGRQIFERMYELLFACCCEKGIRYIWGFTWALKPFRKIGFEIPFHAHMGTYVIRPLPAFRRLSVMNPGNSAWTRFRILGFCFYAWLRSFRGTKSLPQGFKISESRYDSLEALCERMRQQYSGLAALSMDKAFLDYRIYNNAYNQDYFQLALEDQSGNCLAHAFYNINADGYAYLVQFIHDPAAGKPALTAFVHALRKKIGQKNVSMIRYWGFDNHEAAAAGTELLRQGGMTFIDRGISFVWKAMDAPAVSPASLLLSRMASQGAD